MTKCELRDRWLPVGAASRRRARRQGEGQLEVIVGAVLSVGAPTGLEVRAPLFDVVEGAW